MRVAHAFASETTLVVQRFTDSLNAQSACRDIHRDAREASAIRLHDAWARFCRELIVSSASSAPLTANGTIVTRAPGIQNRRQVTPTLRATYVKGKPSWWEPRWADATEAIGAAQRLRLSNLASISAALGASPSPADHLRIVRNFIAHRNEATAQALAVVATAVQAPSTTVEDILVQWSPPGQRVLEEWAARLRLIAFAACA